MDSIDTGRAAQRLRVSHFTGTRHAPSLQDDLKHLWATPRHLPPKYFYDAHGARLFEAICETEDYYPTRAETSLLQQHAAEIMQRTVPAEMLELGAGSATKTRILLSAQADISTGNQSLGEFTYLPQDVSEDMLVSSAEALVDEYPKLQVHALVGDYNTGLAALPWSGSGRRLVIFLGGTIGNFSPQRAPQFMQEISDLLRSGDHVLLGADRVKDAAVLQRAYDDRDGVTARFNKNLLAVLNASAATNFDPQHYAHRAQYRADAQQIEMHLDVLTAQRVDVPGLGVLELEAGESIRTEISRKFTEGDLRGLCTDAALDVVELWTTPEPFSYSLALARKR